MLEEMKRKMLTGVDAETRIGIGYNGDEGGGASSKW